MPPVNQRQKCNTVRGTPGKTHSTDGANSILEIFNLFLDDRIVNTRCNFTNFETSRVFQDMNANAASNRINFLVDVDHVEIRAFLSVLLTARALRL